jgi:tetratricopeptide (TPR) repeat protein
MNDRISSATAVVLALLLVTPCSSFSQDEPRRPALGAAADTNDWAAYYDAGTGWIRSDPKNAADAFFWASRIDPSRPEPFYGRRVAQLLQDRRRLLLYWQGARSVVRSREIQRIDSLYLHALSLNPFFYHRLDRFLLEAIIQEIARDISAGTNIPSGELEYMLDQSVHTGDPALRAWVAYSEGDFDRAERFYGDAIKRARRGRAKALLMTDRGRLYFQRDKGEKALTDLTEALQELRKADRKDLVYVYESKALTEQGVGMVQNRLGNTEAAREAFARSLQEDLSYVPAHVQLAMLALDGKDTLTALSEMDLAVQIRADDAWLRYFYGFTLAEVGRTAEAKEQLNTAIRHNPVYAAPRLALGKVLEAEAQPQEALVQYRAFLSLASANDPRRREAQLRVSALSAAGAP